MPFGAMCSRVISDSSSASRSGQAARPASLRSSTGMVGSGPSGRPDCHGSRRGIRHWPCIEGRQSPVIRYRSNRRRYPGPCTERCKERASIRLVTPDEDLAVAGKCRHQVSRIWRCAPCFTAFALERIAEDDRAVDLVRVIIEHAARYHQALPAYRERIGIPVVGRVGPSIGRTKPIIPISPCILSASKNRKIACGRELRPESELPIRFTARFLSAFPPTARANPYRVNG